MPIFKWLQLTLVAGLAVLAASAMAQDDPANQLGDDIFSFPGDTPEQPADPGAGFGPDIFGTTPPAEYQPEPEVQQAVDEGRQLYEQGEYEDASRKLLQAYQQSNGQFLEANRLLGMVSLELENYAAAFEFLSRVAQDDETYLDDRQFLYDLGRAAAQAASQSRDPAQASSLAQTAVRHLDKAIDLDGTESWADAFHQRGVAYRMLASLGVVEDFDEAIADLQRAADLDDTKKEIFYDLALTQYELEEYQRALENMTRAIELGGDEEYVAGLVGRSAIYVRMGRISDDPQEREDVFRSAIADCERALAENEDEISAYFNAGLSYRYLQEYDEAIRYFSETIDRAAGFSDGYLRRGITWFYMGDYGLASADFEEGLALPDGDRDRRMHFWLGLTRARQGDYAGAIYAYNTALSLAPNFSEAHLNRALSYLKLGDYATAVEGLNRYIRLKPMEPIGYYHRGIAQAQSGNYDRAVWSLERALRLDPEYERARRMLDRVRPRSARR